MKLIIFLVLCLILFLCIIYWKKKQSPIYIITRTGTREQCFFNLKSSLKEQTEKHFIHYKTNDNLNNTFLVNEDNVIPVSRIEKKEKMHCPYNMYLNIPISRINGWILIIDDDTKFVDEHFLKKLRKLCHHTPKSTVLLFKIFYGKNKVILPPNKNIVKSNVDMANLCIHSSVLKKFPFDDQCYGDWRLIESLQKESTPFYMDDSLPIGIWANYSGKMDGFNRECNV